MLGWASKQTEKNGGTVAEAKTKLEVFSLQRNQYPRAEWQTEQFAFVQYDGRWALVWIRATSAGAQAHRRSLVGFG